MAFRPDKDEAKTALLARIAEGLGVPVGSGIHASDANYGNTTVYERGYARVYLPVGGGDLNTRTTTYETEDGLKGKVEAADADEFVARAVAVLSTGRKTRCGEGVNLRQYESWPRFQSIDIPLDSIVGTVTGEGRTRPGWDLNPDYQRDHVWTEVQSRRFVGFFLSDGPRTPVWIHRPDHKTDGADYLHLPEEVIDGQQRVKALMAFFAGTIPAEMEDGKLLWWRDCNEVDRRSMISLNVRYVSMSRRERLSFYLRLNNGGTVHTDAEITKVRKMLEAEG